MSFDKKAVVRLLVAESADLVGMRLEVVETAARVEYCLTRDLWGHHKAEAGFSILAEEFEANGVARLSDLARVRFKFAVQGLWDAVDDRLAGRG